MENDNIIKSFGILNRTFQTYISKAISDEALTYSDSIFLVNIGNREGTNQEEIADLLVIDTAAVARSVKNMEQKGYIKTKRSENDKRVKELYLTDRGKKLCQFLRQLNTQWIDYVLRDLDSVEITKFIFTIEHTSQRAKIFVKDAVK